MLDGGEIKGNFKFDDAGQPLSTAQGNKPDIECDYGDFVLSVEVTMQRGQKQYEAENEPVSRHLGQMKERTKKEAYCLFIAPRINPAALAHFYSQNQVEISYYGGKTKIIPLELDDFMRLVDTAYNSPERPESHNVKRFFDLAIQQILLAKDEIEWNELIVSCIDQWLAV
jgi:hypothetical protein